PEGDVQIPPGPEAGRARGHEVPVSVRGARGWRGAGPVEDRELDHGVEEAQGLVVGDMLLCLRRQKVGQAQMGRGVRHGKSRQNWRVTVAGVPRPRRFESWKIRIASVWPGPSGAPQSAVCWAAV